LYREKYPNSSISQLLSEYIDIIIDNCKNSNIVYSPMSFKISIDRNIRKFTGNAQQDSHELFTPLIDNFIEESKNENITKLFKSICFGKYKQCVECIECQNISETYSEFSNLILEIPPMRNPELKDCFDTSSNDEILTDDNKVFCEKCKKKVTVRKRMIIHEVPEVLIISFKRFNFNNKSNNHMKYSAYSSSRSLSKTVGVTSATKNNTSIKIYSHIELENKKLKLIATVNHYGGLEGGHYTANVLRNGQWYVANDSSITTTSKHAFLNDPSVYMLIYQTNRSSN
jgi:ubiquitin carboxyl-terminal hydrolase 8